MPAPDLPLHAQVAQALGWTECHDRGDGKWFGKKPSDTAFSDIPAYDKTWCNGGFLIVNYVFSLSHQVGSWIAADHDGELFAGLTPLEAVCRLVAYRNRGKNG